MGLILLILLCWLWDGRRGAGRGVPPCGRDRAPYSALEPHGAPWRGSALRVPIPMPAPGVLRAGGGSWLALPGSLGAAFAVLCLAAHHRRPCSVRPGVPTTT